MLTTDPGTLKIRIIAFNALLRHAVRKRKKAAGFLLPPSVSRTHCSGKPKSLRCSFQSSGMFFIICAMDNPSGSAPFT